MTKNLINKENTNLILYKSRTNLNLVKKILSNKIIIKSDFIEEWIKEIWNWADKNNIPDLEYEENIFGEYCKGLPRNKDKLLALTTLNLYDNKLSEIPKEIGNLTNLTYLNLGANNLEELPSEIKNLGNLRELYLWNNHLKILPKEIGNLKNLIKLNIENNSLVELPIEIENLLNLRDFSIKYLNQLILTTSQEIWLSELIEDNCMVWLSATRYNKIFFKKVSKDWIFRLWNWADENKVDDLGWVEEYNDYRGLPRDKKNLLALTELDLYGNQLTELPKEIGNLTNLTTLILWYNELTELPKEIINLSNLTTLNLSNNPDLILSSEQKEWIEKLISKYGKEPKGIRIDDDLLERTYYLPEIDINEDEIPF